MFGHRYPVFLAFLFLVGGLSGDLNAEPLPEFDPLGEERAGRMESLFPEDDDTTLSASTASALHPLTDMRREYLAVLGILAASVFISLRKRPHRVVSRIR